VRAGLLCVESRVAFEPPPAGGFELQGLDPEAAVELGEVLSGAREGRTSDEQITVYKSMGHAVEDAAAASLVLERADQNPRRTPGSMSA
jgi:alanine dehydrogenase